MEQKPEIKKERKATDLETAFFLCKHIDYLVNLRYLVVK